MHWTIISNKPPINSNFGIIQCFSVIACSFAWLLVVSACLVTLVACADSDSNHAAKKRPAHYVEAVRLQHGNLIQSYTASGTLESTRVVRVFNEEAGKIIRLPRHESDAVAAGDELVKLDDSLIKIEIEKASANLRQKRAELKRINKLIRNKHASEDELSRAKTAVEIATAEKKLQNTRLHYTHITAPFAGIISERFFEPDDVVPLHTHILTLYDPESLNVTVELSENVLPLIKNGDTVNVRILALGNIHYKGTISRIHPVIDTGVRKGKVEISITELPGNAAPGQLCTVSFDTSVNNLLLLPLTAIRHDNSGAHVFLVSDKNTIVKTRVETGTRFDRHIEVTNGVVAGDRIVIHGFLGLRNNQNVNIQPDKRQPQ